MMKKDQRGYIVVETILSFSLFIFFCTSILSLINIVVVQARVHYAMSQSALAVSMYDYCFHVTGLDDEISGIAKKAAGLRKDVTEFKGNINTVLDGIAALPGSTSVGSCIDTSKGIYNAGSAAYKQASGWVDTAVNNPKQMVSNLLALGVDAGASAAFEALVRPIIGRYLTNGSMSGDEYLRSMNVIGGLKGLDFFAVTFSDGGSTAKGNSSALNGDGDVIITVSYTVDFRFGSLPLPFDDIDIEQTVVTKAWLGGVGKGYQPG